MTDFRLLTNSGSLRFFFASKKTITVNTYNDNWTEVIETQTKTSAYDSTYYEEYATFYVKHVNNEIVIDNTTFKLRVDIDKPVGDKKGDIIYDNIEGKEISELKELPVTTMYGFDYRPFNRKKRRFINEWGTNFQIIYSSNNNSNLTKGEKTLTGGNTILNHYVVIYTQTNSGRGEGAEALNPDLEILVQEPELDNEINRLFIEKNDYEQKYIFRHRYG